METRKFECLGREFVYLRGEGQPGLAVPEATVRLFQRFDEELQRWSLSLSDCGRLRVWGRSREARTEATAARSRVLVGERRAASSSFISETWFDAAGDVGLELIAMRPAAGSAARRPVDFTPPRNYLNFLEYDGVLFFSGFTSEAPTLEQQLEDVIETYDRALAQAGADWRHVVQLSVLLRCAEDLAGVERALSRGNASLVGDVAFGFVDGFAGEKYQLEIEATAVRSVDRGAAS